MNGLSSYLRRPHLALALSVLLTVLVTPSQGAGALPQQSDGLPFGPSRLDAEFYGQTFTGTKLRIYPDDALESLDEARSGGMRVFIFLAGAQDNYRNTEGTFSLEMWKEAIREFETVDFSEYVLDGTILGHQLVSEPKAPKEWANTVITNDVIDEMARFSKEFWPEIPAVVRVEPTKLAKHAAGYATPWPEFEWEHLDTAWARYSDRKGTAEEYAVEQQDEADKQQLGLVIGLNVFNGGDGSSGLPSPHSPGEWTMSPNELRQYGATMMDLTRSCGFIMWRFESSGSTYEDFEYFRRADIKAATSDLADIAAGEQSPPCTYQVKGRFSDDEGHTFEAAIDWLAEQGITKGCNPPTNTRFCPDDYVTRGQMAAFLVRALDYTDSGNGDLFTDDNGHIFEPAIDKLGTAGVTKGCNPPTNTRFCPDDYVTRGQMAAFLKRALG